MLGKKRSKSAFYAGSSAPVREESSVREESDVREDISIREESPDWEQTWEESTPEEKTIRQNTRTKQEPEPHRDRGAEPLPESEPTPIRMPAKARNLRTHGLFFSADETKRDFSSVLREVQAYLSKEYSSLVTGDSSEEVKAQIRRYAGKYIQDHRIAVDGISVDELIDGIYSEMAEFGFLTKYIYGEGIEEIDVNAWDDVGVQYSGSVNRKLEEHFDSPEHAINVVRRMLHVSGMVLDDASPSVLGHLSKNIRIAVLKTPIVDEDVGVAASIRIVNPQSMKKEDFVNGGTATGEMLDFLSECIRYGISVCVAGATSSGKTTLLGWLLTTIPDSKRIYTIENGSRELALVRRDQTGQVTNSVIHTLTRDSENERQRVDQIALLDMALRFNPDVIVVGEMRGPEANAAQEAARTGVAVVTTIHSMSCDATYRRMVSLCKRAVDMSDETLMGFVTEAYPIVAFCKQLALFSLGGSAAILLGNFFLAPVMAVGFMFLPFWYVKLTANHYKRDISAELDTALSVVTTAYLRTEDIVTAVEENINYLNPPVSRVFRDFLMQIKIVSPDVEAAIKAMKGRIDNEVFREWCDAVCDCQHDRSLKTTLTPIVAKLSDMRNVNAELEYLIVEPRKEFLIMVIFVVGNIPLMYLLNKDWYHVLMHTVLGQIILAVTAAVIFVSAGFVVKLTRPIEYRR